MESRYRTKSKAPWELSSCQAAPLSLSLSRVPLTLPCASLHLSVLCLQRQIFSVRCLVWLLHNFGVQLTLVSPAFRENINCNPFVFRFFIEKYLTASQCSKGALMVAVTEAQGLVHT